MEWLLTLRLFFWKNIALFLIPFFPDKYTQGHPWWCSSQSNRLEVCLESSLLKFYEWYLLSLLYHLKLKMYYWFLSGYSHLSLILGKLSNSNETKKRTQDKNKNTVSVRKFLSTFRGTRDNIPLCQGAEVFTFSEASRTLVECSCLWEKSSHFSSLFLYCFQFVFNYVSILRTDVNIWLWQYIFIYSDQ